MKSSLDNADGYPAGDGHPPQVLRAGMLRCFLALLSLLLSRRVSLPTSPSKNF